jgi:outer membrane protein W
LDIEASGSYFSKDGKALCSNECTNVKIPTFGLGLKYFFYGKNYNNESNFLDKISFFVGAGLKTFFYRENNKSPFVAQCVKKTTVGGMVNLGLEYTTKKNFFIDLFFDYNFKKLKPCCNNSCNECEPSCRFDIDLGGLVAGIGLGYKL